MLGILKAGGAYLILDPSYPPERSSFMVKDAQVSVLLTRQGINSLSNSESRLKTTEGGQVSSRLQPTSAMSQGIYSLVDDGEVQNLETQSDDKIHHPRVVFLDTDWEMISQEIADNPTSAVTAENLVYAIYTSGSTGKPKGVEIEHGSLLNLVFWHQREFGVSAGDRATQIAAIGFDACGWEIWPYLAAGASIYFPEDDIRRDPEKLQNWLVSNAITISFLPTPLAEKVLLLDSASNNSVANLARRRRKTATTSFKIPSI